MKQDIINKAQNIINQKRQKAEQEYNAQLAKLRQNAEFEKLEKEYSRVMIQNAKDESYGKKVDKTQENALKNALEMQKNGIFVNYACKNCQDRGYVNGKMCQCLKTEINNLLKQNSGFEKLENFADAQKTCGDLAPVYALMQKWCKSDFKKNLVYIAGPTGVGKTYLIRCMANELITRGLFCQITTAYNLNQTFKEFSRTQNEQLLNQFTDIQVLFIDDLGTEPQYKNITQELLYSVINERKMKKLPTVITSNLDMENLRDQYGERIFSRIADRDTSITLFIDGEDKRISKK